MSAIPSHTQSEFVSPSLLVKPSADAAIVRPPNLKIDPPLRPKRSWSSKMIPAAFAYLIVLLVGVAATLAWQTYGNAARHMIASAAYSLDRQPFNAISLDLDAIRQRIDALATSAATNQAQMLLRIDQLAADQEQMTREITKLQAVEQYVLYKESDPPLPPTPALVPKPASRPSQAPTALTPARNP